jgi:hypothetical protein
MKEEELLQQISQTSTTNTGPEDVAVSNIFATKNWYWFWKEIAECVKVLDERSVSELQLNVIFLRKSS